MNMNEAIMSKINKQSFSTNTYKHENHFLTNNPLPYPWYKERSFAESTLYRFAK